MKNFTTDACEECEECNSTNLTVNYDLTNVTGWTNTSYNSTNGWTVNVTYTGNETICPECPGASGLLIDNPNPGNGSHSTNYLQPDSPLTTAVDITWEDFTDALLPGSYSMEFDSLSYNGPTLENHSSVYADVNANGTGSVIPGHNYLGQYITGGDYYIDRSYLIFNTTTLPDEAEIDSAYITMVVFDDQSAVDFNVSLRERRDPSPHNPMQPSDYFRNAFVDEYATRNTSGYTDEDWFNLTLPILAYPDIDPAGHTKFGLRSDQDVDQSAPVGPAPEYIGFYGPGGVDPWKAPHLIINFTIPASNWQDYINVTWSSNTSGAWATYYISQVNSNGTIAVPNLNMTNYSTTYHWRIVAENNGSTVWNETFQFTTEANQSTNASDCGIGDDEFLVLIPLGCFFLFLFTGYRTKKRSGGAFMLLSAIFLFSLEFLLPFDPLVIAFVSPFAILILLLGINKWLHAKDETAKQSAQ